MLRTPVSSEVYLKKLEKMSKQLLLMSKYVFISYHILSCQEKVELYLKVPYGGFFVNTQTLCLDSVFLKIYCMYP